MAETAYFKCLRCGFEFVGEYTPKVVEERSCPKCGSNSVRRLKARPAGKEAN
jgi:DNA-directed RNA polymerase subunit RPC12/RpoP